MADLRYSMCAWIELMSSCRWWGYLNNGRCYYGSLVDALSCINFSYYSLMDKLRPSLTHDESLKARLYLPIEHFCDMLKTNAIPKKLISNEEN